MENAHHVEPVEYIHVIRDSFIPLNYDELGSTVLQEMQAEIFWLTLIIQKSIEPTDDMLERLSKTLLLINTNLPLLSRFFKHIDTVHTIIQYLNFAYNLLIESEKYDLILPILFTMFDICNNPHVNSFLLQSIIKYTQFGERVYSNYSGIFHYYVTNIYFYQRHHLIILKDSDVYAVIKYLKRSDHLAYLKHIWVHKLIYSKFCWLLEYYQIICSEITIFQSKLDIVFDISNEYTPKVINIISIWSADIIGAKVFARCLKATVIFINAHMNFYGNTVVFPYSKLSLEYKNNWSYYVLNDATIVPHTRAELKLNTQCYNLYYDGMWQKPLNDTYWQYENKIWANATQNDFERCINSARKGIEIWSTMSIDMKTNILLKIVSALERDEDIELSCLVSKWIDSAVMCNNSLTSYNSSETGEVVTIHKPRGILLLHESSKVVLFHKLILTLLTGNTVIILITKHSYTSVVSYFNTFLTCNIPPGVINLLSSTMNLKNIKSGFCIIPDTSKYNLEINNDEIFMSSDKVDEIYSNLILPMYIILPLQ